MKEKEKRPTIQDGAGMPRYNRYKAAIRQCNKARQNGFFIEAIALEESLIADRLESLTNELNNGGWSYKPTGMLVSFLLKELQHRLNNEIKNCLVKIQSWCKKRNAAIHRMAKLTPDMERLFEEDYTMLADIAEEGLLIFREIDNTILTFRKPIKS